MSTTYTVLKKPINDKVNYILDVTEQSTEFTLGVEREDKETNYYFDDGGVESPRLTGDELIEGAVKMIQCALYGGFSDSKEKHKEVIRKVKDLVF